MRLSTFTATLVAAPSAAFAQTSSWANWTPGQPVTTTITKTLMHFNETTTMTSYSSTATTSATTSKVVANVTTSIYSAPANATIGTNSAPASTAVSPLASSTTAVIATFPTGAAMAQELDVALVAIAGIGALAYGLF